MIYVGIWRQNNGKLISRWSRIKNNPCGLDEWWDEDGEQVEKDYELL